MFVSEIDSTPCTVTSFERFQTCFAHIAYPKRLFSTYTASNLRRESTAHPEVWTNATTALGEPGSRSVDFCILSFLRNPYSSPVFFLVDPWSLILVRMHLRASCMVFVALGLLTLDIQSPTTPNQPCLSVSILTTTKRRTWQKDEQQRPPTYWTGEQR